MARYIDADKIDYTVTMVGRDEYAGYRAVAFESDIDAMPTADVAPRAEVERLRELNNSLLEAGQEWQKRYENLAREIFEEIEELFRQHKEGGYYLNGAWFPERLDLYTEDAFEELKKKYAEGKDDT